MNFEKQLENSRIEKSILESLLVNSTTRNNKTVSSDYRTIANIVIKAAYEYISGETCDFECPNYIINCNGEKVYSTKTDFFEPNLFDYFQKNISAKLTPYLKKHLSNLLEPSLHSDRWNDSWYETELQRHCNKLGWLGYSYFEVDKSMKKKSEDYLNTLDSNVQSELKSIGKLMRKYMDFKKIRR